MHFSESQRTDLVDRIRRLSRPVEPLPTGETPRPLPGAPVRAVLFDLYGTLYISAAGDIGTEETGARAVYHEAAAAAGIQLPPGSRIDWGAEFRAEIARQHARRRADGVACPEVDVRHIWRAVLEPDGRRMSDEAILRFAVEVECRINPVWPMPGARAAPRLERAVFYAASVRRAARYAGRAGRVQPALLRLVLAGRRGQAVAPSAAQGLDGAAGRACNRAR
jgi:putative hydrolase of the HAD superfamily